MSRWRDLEGGRLRNVDQFGRDGQAFGSSFKNEGREEGVQWKLNKGELERQYDPAILLCVHPEGMDSVLSEMPALPCSL